MDRRHTAFYEWLSSQLLQQNAAERIVERQGVKAEHKAKAETYRFVMDQFQKHFAGE